MPKILIEPVPIKTTGGLDAEINGIDPSDHDCLCGKVGQQQNVRWDGHGLMRNGNVNANLDPQQTYFREIMELIDSIRNS